MAAPTTPSHYEILGVSETATIEEIRSAYRAAARKAHPDSGGRGDRMQHLNRAWDVLQDRDRRAAYDQDLATARRPPTPDPSPSSPTAPAGSSGSPQTGPRTVDDPLFDPYDDIVDPYEDDDLVFAGFDPDNVPPVEGWWALFPPAVLVVAIGLFSMAILFASPAFLVLGGGALFISLGLFVLVPLRAMLHASRSRPPLREE